MTSKSRETESEDVITTSTYEELLQEVIHKQSGNVDLVVKVKDIRDAVPVGNNFLSQLHRLSVDISNGDKVEDRKSFIIKTFPKGENLQKIMKEVGFFKTEIIMYRTILPKINRLCSNVIGCSPLSANFFDTGKDNILVLEDLKQEGYRMVDRHVGLDLAHCKMAVKALARLHGISVSLIDADRSILNTLREDPPYEDRVQKEDKFVRPQYMGLSEIVEGWSGSERFGAKLRHVSLSAGEKLVRLKDPKNTEIVVLNHGDFWLNNMLFKYSATGDVEDIKIIDFQIADFASPAIDLHYFLITSPTDEVKNSGTETLLEVYHAELCRVLEALGCSAKSVTLKWLKEEMKDKMFIALHTACTDLSLVVAEQDDVSDFSGISDDFVLDGQKSIFHKSYSGARYRETLEKLLPIFEKHGVL